jgi:predicted ester cyclase
MSPAWGVNAMTNDDLKARYGEYLDALNKRRLDDLELYVHDEVSYNGELMTLQRFQNMLLADIAAIPDLVFDAQIIVADGDRLASRLLFDCTPRYDNLGRITDGRPLHVVDHVFYEFRDGRIASVVSLVDRAAIHAQLRPVTG